MEKPVSPALKYILFLAFLLFVLQIIFISLEKYFIVKDLFLAIEIVSVIFLVFVFTFLIRKLIVQYFKK
jgi:hypothetical protein